MATSEELNVGSGGGLDDYDDDIELVNEKPLSWFDVSAIGTGEMLFTAGWAWIVFVASSYGIKWTLIGFVAGVDRHPLRLVALPGDDHRGPRAGIAAVLRPRSRGLLARHVLPHPLRPCVRRLHVARAAGGQGTAHGAVPVGARRALAVRRAAARASA